MTSSYLVPPAKPGGGGPPGGGSPPPGGKGGAPGGTPIPGGGGIIPGGGKPTGGKGGRAVFQFEFKSMRVTGNNVVGWEHTSCETGWHGRPTKAHGRSKIRGRGSQVLR